eukprot:CAMPEP_0117501612 /NCGR_PEP_ID=MMETSP0784-20121206/23389_1 /TAXON_ID=39447 /ORGANISM="" /LENGTH=756 /DNA_ID=CAMNT_0005296873 /DNA_START=86 /DNA_END=2356 /DNA_ORIENTATION=-
MAYVEKALYCGRHRFDQWDVGDSIVYGPLVDASRIRFVDDDSAKAAAGVGRMVQPEGCFAAFQGSHDRVNAVMDAMFWQAAFHRESCTGCMVDFGFLHSYESIKAKVFDALVEIGCQSRPLYIVGHSLGAAMAHYLLYDAIDLGYKVNSIYALESPRPGDDAFAKSLWAKLEGVNAWRTTHFKDIVVQTPESLIYKHVLPEVYYTSHNGSSYKVCRHDIVDGVPREDPSCARRWGQWEIGTDDHLWYAAMNPTGCQNDTSMTPGMLPKYRRDVAAAAVGCLDAFNVLFESTTAMPGAATCGQRINWLRTVDGGDFSTTAAMSEIARLFPGPCAPCAAYNEPLGLSLAYVEKAFSCGKDRFDRWDVGDSMVYGPLVDPSRVRVVDDNITKANAGVGVMLDPKGCFVAMQGQAGKISAVLDVWLSPFDRNECHDCKVDPSFLKSYDAIKAHVFNTLVEFGCPYRAVYLVGKGVGAAMVQYLLFDLIEQSYDIRHVYALESPRPGNTAFARTLWTKVRASNIDAWRTSHYKDNFVHWPGSLFYRHVLPEIYYTSLNGSEYRKCIWQEVDGIPKEDVHCSYQWRPWELDFHDPGWYGGINPAYCQNDTQMSVDELFRYRNMVSALAPMCMSSFNVRFTSRFAMVGVATCGQRINWLRTYAGGSYSTAGAMTEVARLFPEHCGPCEVAELATRFRGWRIPAMVEYYAVELIVAVPTVIVICLFFCCFTLIRSVFRRLRLRQYFEVAHDEESGGDEEKDALE